MALPTVTYTFINGQPSDGPQVSQNFTDLIAAMTDGTKDHTIAGLTCTTLSATGNVALGDASTDVTTIVNTFKFQIDGSSNPEFVYNYNSAAKPTIVRNGVDSQSLRMAGGSGGFTGGGLVFYGNSHASLPGVTEFYQNGTLSATFDINSKFIVSKAICYSRTNVASAASITAMSNASPFIYLTGVTATTIHGISSTNVVDGQIIQILNKTGANLTIANESATETTAANRFDTLSGTDNVSTGDGTICVMYSTTTSRWICINSRG